MSSSLLEIRQLRAGYGDAEVLHGIDLSVLRGEFVCIIGANTAGKSTILRAISRLIPKSSGIVRFDAVDLMTLAAHEIPALGIAHVPEGRQIFPEMTVEENLLVAERSRERHGWDLDRVYALFPRLKERRVQRAKTLSGGEQQMLAIGRGLMTNPDCLIMDEPSEGLAPIIIQGVWEAIGKLKSEGLSILLVEQNAALALKLVDFVHVMSKGQVVYSGAPQELAASADIKAKYLGI